MRVGGGVWVGLNEGFFYLQGPLPHSVYRILSTGYPPLE